jgi:LPXTG-motif cell wall-anchored protein
VEQEIHHYLLAISIALAIALAAYLVWRRRRRA